MSSDRPARRARAGFTTSEPWIPLLMVVILAAVAFVSFRRTAHAARQRAILEHGLDLVAQGQREYLRFNHVYAGRFGPRMADGVARAEPDTVLAITIVHADSTGWAAVGTIPTLTGRRSHCGIFGGTGPPPNPEVTRPDTVDCW